MTKAFASLIAALDCSPPVLFETQPSDVFSYFAESLQ